MVSSTGTPYLYGNGNPVTFTDPTGLCWWDLCLLELTAAEAAAVAVAAWVAGDAIDGDCDTCTAASDVADAWSEALSGQADRTSNSTQAQEVAAYERHRMAAEARQNATSMGVPTSMYLPNLPPSQIDALVAYVAARGATSTLGNGLTLSYEHGGGKNAQHGDGGRKESALDKQIKQAQDQLLQLQQTPGSSAKAKDRLAQKIKNLKIEAAKAKKGENHSQTPKGP